MKFVLFRCLDAAVVLGVIACAAPVNQNQPRFGLDPSWAIALNEALVRHLRFGSQIVFTYGPYAALGSLAYSPETGQIALLGSVFVGASIALAVIYLAEGRPRWIIWLAPVFFSSIILPDSTFLALPILVVALSHQTSFGTLGRGKLDISLFLVPVLAMLLVSLALLLLVKGSLIPPVLLAVAISIAMTIRKFFWGTMIALIFWLLSICLLWIAASQPLVGLPAYFLSQAPIVGGYAEGMSLWGGQPRYRLLHRGSLRSFDSCLVQFS